jgi:hypothetical protein
MALTNAERQRRFRLRQKQGAVCITIGVMPAVVEALIDSGRISEADAIEPAKLAETVERTLDRIATRQLNEKLIRNAVTPARF